MQILDSVEVKRSIAFAVTAVFGLSFIAICLFPIHGLYHYRVKFSGAVLAALLGGYAFFLAGIGAIAISALANPILRTHAFMFPKTREYSEIFYLPATKVANFLLNATSLACTWSHGFWCTGFGTLLSLGLGFLSQGLLGAALGFCVWKARKRFSANKPAKAA